MEVIDLPHLQTQREVERLENELIVINIEEAKDENEPDSIQDKSNGDEEELHEEFEELCDLKEGNERNNEIKEGEKETANKDPQIEESKEIQPKESCKNSFFYFNVL